MALYKVSVIVNLDFLELSTQKSFQVEEQKMLKYDVAVVNHSEMNCFGMFYLSGLVSWGQLAFVWMEIFVVFLYAVVEYLR